MINFDNVNNVLYNKIQPLIEDLDGLHVTDVEDTKEKAEARTYKAEVSRKLLELADLLALTESLVRNEYWFLKGVGLDIEIGVLND